MSRNKIDDPKTARISLCFRQSEINDWKNYQLNSGYKSFSEFVRQAINEFIKGEKNV